LNKTSKPSRIYIIFRNHGSYIWGIPATCIGIWYSVKFFKLCFSGDMGWFGGILAVALLTIWGLILGRFAAPRIGNWFGNIFYAPKEYLKTAPDIMSPIKGKIARREYDEAIEELNALLEEKPFSPEPYLIIVEIYATELMDYLNAMELIENYFNQKKVYAFEENIEMLLLYADICQEHNYLQKAQRLLEQEVKRKGYPAIKRKRLQTRLEAIAL
jgi:hypothetical protein